jgi:outer membrane protein assembly factor BamB
MKRKWLAIGIILVFVFSISGPLSAGLYFTTPLQIERQLTNPLEGPMDSAWPMFGHDLRHTGRSPYSTVDNLGGLKWKFTTDWLIETSPVIDKNNTIYVASWNYLFAIYPNGTEKWRWNHPTLQDSSPALADDGTIYIGTNVVKKSGDDKSGKQSLFAIHPDGTVKWSFLGSGAFNTPVISPDGTIYVNTFTNNGMFYAVNPNGTEKWHYDAQYFCQAPPAIADDGTIYFNSQKALYAFSSNGTLKWKLDGSFVGGPAVADDGTIYLPCDPGFLYAIYPNGTVKWHADTEWGSWATPVIGLDGTIYIGYKHLFAYHSNGTLKWVFRPDNDEWHNIDSQTYAISADGTIYIGTMKDNENCFLIGVNPNGTEKWREWISDWRALSSPVIAEDGTIYIGAQMDDSGVLYALNGKRPVIEKPLQGNLYIFDKEKRPTLYGNTLCVGPITIEVTHPDPVNVSKVEFYLDGEKEYETTTPPYEWMYRKISFKPHMITVRATMNGGIIGTDTITFRKLF